MRHALRRFGRGSLLTGLVSSATGQAAERAALAGQVAGRGGTPIAEAHVVLVHRPIGWCAQYGDVDVVRVNTDAKGRFKAEVLPARAYSAFATWRTGTEAAASVVAENVAAGAFVSLIEQEAPAVAVTVRVDGLEAWAAVGPLGFRVVPRLANLWPIPVMANADGTVTLPALPGTSALLEVTTRDRHTLFSTWVGRSEERRSTAGAAATATAAPLVVSVPPPVAIPIEVVDAASGKPVAGAAIELRSSWLAYRVAFPTLDSVQHSRECWRPVGTTDAEGRATVTVPTKAGPWPLPKDIHVAFAVRAENHAMAFAGWTHEGAFWEGKARSENPNPLRIPLHPQRPVTGRLTLDGKTPAAGLTVILWTDVQVTNRNEGGGSSWDAPVQFATTDARGGFSFPQAASGAVPLRLGVALDHVESRERLAVDGLLPMLLAVPFPEAVAQSAVGRKETARELGEGSLGREHPVVVRLVDSTGSPVRGAEVFLLPANGSSDVIAPHNTTDGSGRCLLFPVAAGQVLVSVMPGLGYVIAPMTGDPDQEVRMEPFSFLAGRVLQADGSAAPEASLSCSGVRAVFPGSLSEPERSLRRLAQRMNDHVGNTRCDRDGRFRLPYLPMREASLRIHVWSGTPDARQSTTVTVACDPDRKPEPIEVRLGR